MRKTQLYAVGILGTSLTITLQLTQMKNKWSDKKNWAAKAQSNSQIWKTKIQESLGFIEHVQDRGCRLRSLYATDQHRRVSVKEVNLSSSWLSSSILNRSSSQPLIYMWWYYYMYTIRSIPFSIDFISAFLTSLHLLLSWMIQHTRHRSDTKLCISENLRLYLTHLFRCSHTANLIKLLLKIQMGCLCNRR